MQFTVRAGTIPCSSAGNAPTVSITDPAANSAFSAPATVTLTADAQDSDGTVAQVAFFANGNPIGTATSNPFTVQWANVQAGAYSLTAVATDNEGLQTASTAVPITVGAGKALYFIHVDHLNTPRLVADGTQKTVWRWDQAEPFGNSPADEDSDGDAITFSFPQRFPGQYYDAETLLHYNYFRNYDLSIGRYARFDPVGLRGGINGYAYASGVPLTLGDTFGLKGSGGFSTRYGNWCGRNYSGGQTGRLIPNNPAGPVDSLDECCMNHDYCWAKYECPKGCMTSKERKRGKAQCDREIVDCLTALDGKAPRNWPKPPPRGAESEAYFFCQKAKWWFKD